MIKKKNFLSQPYGTKFLKITPPTFGGGVFLGTLNSPTPPPTKVLGCKIFLFSVLPLLKICIRCSVETFFYGLYLLGFAVNCLFILFQQLRCFLKSGSYAKILLGFSRIYYLYLFSMLILFNLVLLHDVLSNLSQCYEINTDKLIYRDHQHFVFFDSDREEVSTSHKRCGGSYDSCSKDYLPQTPTVCKRIKLTEIDKDIYSNFIDYLLRMKELDSCKSRDDYLNSYLIKTSSAVLKNPQVQNQVKSYEVKSCDSYLKNIKFTEDLQLNKSKLIDAIMRRLSYINKDIFLKNGDQYELILLPKYPLDCNHVYFDDKAYTTDKPVFNPCDCLNDPQGRAKDTDGGVDENDLKEYEPFLIRKDLKLDYIKKIDGKEKKKYIHRVYHVTKNFINEQKVGAQKGIGICEMDSLLITSKKINEGGNLAIKCRGDTQNISHYCNIPMAYMKYSFANQLKLNITEIRDINPYISKSVIGIMEGKLKTESGPEGTSEEPLRGEAIHPIQSGNPKISVDDPKLGLIESFILESFRKDEKNTLFDLEMSKIYNSTDGFGLAEIKSKLIQFYYAITKEKSEKQKLSDDNCFSATNRRFGAADFSLIESKNSSGRRSIGAAFRSLIIIDGIELDTAYLKMDENFRFQLLEHRNAEHFLLSKNLRVGLKGGPPEQGSGEAAHRLNIELFKVYSYPNHVPLFMAGNTNQINDILDTELKLKNFFEDSCSGGNSYINTKNVVPEIILTVPNKNTKIKIVVDTLLF